MPPSYNKQAAKEGAGIARKTLGHKTNEPVVSEDNYLNLDQNKSKKSKKSIDKDER